MPPKMISDTIARSSMSDRRPSSVSCASTRFETTSSPGSRRRSAISSSDTAYRFASAASIRSRSSRMVTPNASPMSVDHRARSCQWLSSMPDQLAQHARGVRLGELRDELAAAVAGIGVDQLVRERLELGHHSLDQRAREGRVAELSQPPVVVALLAQHDLGPPLRQQPLLDAVLRRPGEAALPQPAVLEQGADLVVAQHRQSERRAGAPAARARVGHLSRRDREGRVGDVEVRDLGAVDRLCHGHGIACRYISRCQSVTAPQNRSHSSVRAAVKAS